MEKLINETNVSNDPIQIWIDRNFDGSVKQAENVANAFRQAGIEVGFDGDNHLNVNPEFLYY